MDSAGNLYIADSGNGMIRKVSASTGDITAIAGKAEASGTQEITARRRQRPWSSTSGLAVDAAGDVFISRIRPTRSEEVAAASGTQWGIAMTAGDIYLIAGSSTGGSGTAASGTGHLGPAGRPRRARG